MIVGLETEYGIMVEEGAAITPAAACQQFFDLWRPHHLASWDFATEQPWQDARGWLDLKTPLAPPEPITAQQSAGLEQTKASKEAKSAPTISLVDRSNYNAMLPNGARFYIDHAHPEYSTPECASVDDLIAADVAGQWFLAGVAEQIAERSSSNHKFTLYRNNTDFRGNSYGCHENYLMSADAYVALFGNRQHRLFTFLIPFLVTRQIFCGVGRVGAEDGSSTCFQISQRADFVETVIGLQTVERRPIVNTRDEPHADRSIHRRLHVIVGDSNMAEPTTRLKVGVTGLVLDMLEAGWGGLNLALADPVAAIKAVSRDLTCKQPVIDLEGRQKPVSALDVQRQYLEQAREFLDGREATPQQEAVWTEWQQTLDALESDWQSLGRKIDWIIKYQLLESQIAKRGLSWESAVVKEMDIKYHGINPDRSFYHLLLRDDLIDRVVTDAEVKERLVSPPPETRAALRCQLSSALDSVLLAVNWDCLTLLDAANAQFVRLHLPDPTCNGTEFREALLASSDVLMDAAQRFPVERFNLVNTKE